MQMWKYSFTFQLGALKADQCSMLGQPSYHTQRDWVLSCWLAFFLSSCRAQPPIALPQRDSFACQCQLAKPGLASHNQEALPLPVMIILTVLLSPYIICHLLLSTYPFLESASSIYRIRVGGKRNRAIVRSLPVSFLLSTKWWAQ